MYTIWCRVRNIEVKNRFGLDEIVGVLKSKKVPRMVAICRKIGRRKVDTFLQQLIKYYVTFAFFKLLKIGFMVFCLCYGVVIRY